MPAAHLYFRAVQDTEGCTCKRGRHELDHHAAFEDAVAHLDELAIAYRPSEVIAHYASGTTETVHLFQ